MATWTSVKTWASEILTASDLNTYVRDDLEYLKAQTDTLAFSGFVVDRNVSTQSIPDSTWTLISFTRELYDVGGWIAVTSATATTPASAIPAGYTTVVIDARYSVAFAANSTGVRKARMNRTADHFGANGFSASSADTTDLVASMFTSAVVGDTFQLEVYQTSGGSLNVSSVTLAVAVYKPLS